MRAQRIRVRWIYMFHYKDSNCVTLLLLLLLLSSGFISSSGWLQSCWQSGCHHDWLCGTNVDLRLLVLCLCLCSFLPLSSPLSPSLSWLICASVRPNTDGFMTWWFLATPWVSLSTCLLHSGVGSASAGHLPAFVISSVCACAWMYCSADSIEHKKESRVYCDRHF